MSSEPIHRKSAVADTSPSAPPGAGVGRDAGVEPAAAVGAAAAAAPTAVPSQLPVPRADVVWLHDKFQRLVALRDLGRRAPREALRELAAEYPGVLREMDRTSPATIERRRRVLVEALAAGAGAPLLPSWVALSVAQHRALARELAGRRVAGAAGGRGAPSRAALRRVADAHGVAVDDLQRLLWVDERQRRASASDENLHRVTSRGK